MPTIDYRIVYRYVQTATSPVARPMLVIAVRNSPHRPLPVVSLIEVPPTYRSR